MRTLKQPFFREAAMFKPRLFDLLDHLKCIPQIISLYERGEKIEYIGALVGVHPSNVRKGRPTIRGNRSQTRQALTTLVVLTCSAVDSAKLQVRRRSFCAQKEGVMRAK
jgi:hypothetical protein